MKPIPPTKSKGRMAFLGVRVPIKTQAELIVLAKKNDVALSWLCRKAIKDLLKNYKPLRLR